MKRIIYTDRMEFIPGMQERFNICKSINVIHHINKLKNKNLMIGISHHGAVETNLTRNHEVWVQSLALLSGLRIWHCCELWRRSQMLLGSHIAVVLAQAGSNSSNSTPSLGTSIWHRCSPKKTTHTYTHTHTHTKYDHLNRWRKSFWQNITSMYDKKNLQKVGTEGTCLNIIKSIYDRPTANIILNSEKLKIFPPSPGTRQGFPLSPLLFNIVL